MNYANLMVTRDSSDEVTLYALSDEVYNRIEEIIETMKDQRDPDLDDKLEKIFKILDTDDEYLQRKFMQTFCWESISWPEYAFKRIMCLPVY